MSWGLKVVNVPLCVLWIKRLIFRFQNLVWFLKIGMLCVLGWNVSIKSFFRLTNLKSLGSIQTHLLVGSQLRMFGFVDPHLDIV